MVDERFWVCSPLSTHVGILFASPLATPSFILFLSHFYSYDHEHRHNDIENGGDRYSGRDTNSDIGSASTRKHQITYSMADEIKAEEDPRMRHATTVDMIELGIRNKNGSSSGPQDKLAREKRRRDLEVTYAFIVAERIARSNML